MPVRIWTMKRVSDALPNTYHQPIGPAASRGIGCRIIGSRLSRRRRRTSNQLPTARNIIRSPFCESSRSGLVSQRVVEGREMRRLDLQHIQAPNSGHAIDTMVEAARRWAGGVFAVGVIDAPVTWAHEEAGLGEPLHWAAQVGAIDSEDQELVAFRGVRLLLVSALVAHIDSGVSHHAVPRPANGAVKSHQSCLVFGEVLDEPQHDPID